MDGCASIVRPATTSLHHLFADTGCWEDLRGAMDDRDGWRDKVKEICAVSVVDVNDDDEEEIVSNIAI